MGDVLHAILARKAERVAEAKRRKPLPHLLAEMRERDARRPSLREACAHSDRLNIIAEVKRASPSCGVLREDFDPVALAREYEAGGAVALSILTEEDHFQGALAHLLEIRRVVSLPILRKDFVFDPYQLYESAAAGADAVLLIAAVLGRAQLSDLLRLAEELQLDALVEVHDPKDVERALAAGATFIGVNNRDLRTFAVSLQTSRDLISLLPEGTIRVSESGLRARRDLDELRRLGYHAFLIGEHLMRAPHPGHALRELLGT